VNEHQMCTDLLPQYAAGTLDDQRRLTVEDHVAQCAACQEELHLWKVLSEEIVSAGRQVEAPSELVETAIQTIREQDRQPSTAQRISLLLQGQLPLVRREIWLAAAAVMALGYVVALLAGRASVIQILAPMVAAASVALIYGSEHDPALELVLATPVSPRQILLARLVLVFGFDLCLSILASLALTPLLPQGKLWGVIMSWLGPMTFLSAVALVLSLWVGAANGVTVAYALWLGQYVTQLLAQEPVPGLGQHPAVVQGLALYWQFWQSPWLLFVLALMLIGFAVWYVGQQERTLPRYGTLI
jgi:hypothetical protein